MNGPRDVFFDAERFVFLINLALLAPWIGAWHVYVGSSMKLGHAFSIISASSKATVEKYYS